MSAVAAGLPDAGEFLGAVARAVESLARRDLAIRPTAWPRDVAWEPAAEAARYALEAGGKRLRPGLVVATAAACLSPATDPLALLAGETGPLPAGGTHGDILAVATAFEYIHTYSLIHDDLPVMDNDALRRGRPATHVAHGVPAAVLAGAFLMARAFALIASTGLPSRPALATTLRDAAGVRGMVGGQALDILGEHRAANVEELVRIHAHKTAALIRGAVVAGAQAVSAPPAAIEAARNVGESAGLAFQIVDDLLDVSSTAALMGKPTGVDAGKGKRTYPAVLGVEPSRARAAALVARAEDGLQVAGWQGTMLASLVQYVLCRVN